MSPVRRIKGGVGLFPKTDAALMLEIGCQQASAVTDLIRQTAKFQDPAVHRDFQGRDRVVVARKADA